MEFIFALLVFIIIIVLLCIIAFLKQYITVQQEQVAELQKKLSQLTLENIVVDRNNYKPLDCATLDKQSLSMTSQIDSTDKSSQIATDTKINHHVSSINSDQNNKAANKLNKSHRVVKTSFSYKLFSWFIIGNKITQLGIAILFLGLSSLFNYIFQHQQITPELIILGALVISFGLLIIGWKLRHKRKIYAAILQGGAIAILYLITFAAYLLYGFIPLTLAFLLLVLICAVNILFAVLQKAQTLTFIAFIGGYLAPMVLSNSLDNLIVLFSYYLILSSLILVINIIQSWRILILIGFFFSFIPQIFILKEHFRPEIYTQWQIYIIANMLIYGILATLLPLTKTQTHQRHPNWGDFILLFGTPLLGFILQYSITCQWQFGPLVSALAFGLFYIIGAYLIFCLWLTSEKNLFLSWLAIGVTFCSLIILFVVDMSLTSLFILLGGSAVGWIMLSKKSYRMAALNIIIIFISFIYTCGAIETIESNNILTISILSITSLTLLINGCLWHYYAKNIDYVMFIKIGYLVFTIAIWIAMIAISAAIITNYNMPSILMPYLLGFTVSTWLWYLLGKILNWQALRYSVLILWFVIPSILLFSKFYHYYYLNFDFWNLVWVIALISCYYYLDSLKKLTTSNNVQSENQTIHVLLILLHLSLFFMIFIGFYREIMHLINQLVECYSLKWCIIITCESCIILIFYLLVKYQTTAKQSLLKYYWTVGLLPVVILIVYQLSVGLILSRDIIHGYVIPIFNPLEACAIFGIIMLGIWIKVKEHILQLDTDNISLNTSKILLNLLIFFWVNSILLHALAQATDTVWPALYLWQDNFIQVSISLFWMLSAVILVIIGNHFSKRSIWYTGVSIQAIVIIKSIFVDYNELDRLANALAFIGLALFMLIIGYCAPLPSENNAKNKE